MLEQRQFFVSYGNEWLDGAVIDAYSLLASVKSHRPIGCFNVHSLPMMEKTMPKAPPHSTDTREISKHRHLARMVVVQFRKRITYYDSMTPLNINVKSVEYLMLLIRACCGPMT